MKCQFCNDINLSVYIDDQKGNYRITRRENDDAKTLLGWEPKDRLKEYIKSL